MFALVRQDIRKEDKDTKNTHNFKLILQKCVASYTQYTLKKYVNTNECSFTLEGYFFLSLHG